MTSPLLQIEGISLASGVMLLMLAACFRVGQALRPAWGLSWVSLAMAVSGGRSMLYAFGLQGEQWIWAHELLGCVYIAALLVGLSAYAGRTGWPAWRHFLVATASMVLVVAVGRALGSGFIAFYLVLTVTYFYLGSMLLRRRPSAGQTHLLFNMVVLLFPVLVPGIGMGLMRLQIYQMPGWASLSIAMLGLALLLATSGRLRQELQLELEARTRAEEALRTLNESLEQRIETRTEELQGLVAGLESFNRMVSHDLRGPLGGLSGVAELARRAQEAGDGPRVAQLLGLIGTETRRLGELVTQLLVLARVSNAELALAETPLDQVLAEALQSLALSQGEACLARIKTQPLPSAEVDPQLMRQVFVNLIGNALKFSSQAAEPEVRVRSEPERQSLVIEVRDNGPGFEPAQAQLLFQPFRRLHGQQFDGSGIGLTIVKRIIERHGGQVWAEGRPSQGASFFFRLPISAATAVH